MEKWEYFSEQLIEPFFEMLQRNFEASAVKNLYHDKLKFRKENWTIKVTLRIE